MRLFAFLMICTLLSLAGSRFAPKVTCLRQPASVGLTCSAFVPPPKSPVVVSGLEEAETYAAHLDSYQKKISEARSPDELKRIKSTELRAHLSEGRTKFLDQDGQLIFKNKMQEVLDASGARRASVFTVEHNGRSYFVKQLRADRAVESIIQEIQNAKLLASLGLSPETNLASSKNVPYLIMEHAPGINIKEVLIPESRNHSSKKRIDEVLGVETSSIEEAARTFARIMSSNPAYANRLREITNILEAYNYTDTSDFQFMVDLNKGPSSILLIDTEDFRRNTIPDDDFPSPEFSVRYFLNLIQDFLI